MCLPQPSASFHKRWISSLKQLALLFVTPVAFNEPFVFGLACFLSASLLDVPQPGSWALQRGRLLSHLLGSSGVSSSLNQMMWKCVHRPKYKNVIALCAFCNKHIITNQRTKLEWSYLNYWEKIHGSETKPCITCKNTERHITCTIFLILPLFKVLWRYKGKTPETLGSNTRIYDWIPQNDLLGETDAICDALCPWKYCFLRCFSTKIAYSCKGTMQRLWLQLVFQLKQQRFAHGALIP